jgi:Platelet-activating factor acetylhydrolase, isoform II
VSFNQGFIDHKRLVDVDNLGPINVLGGLPRLFYSFSVGMLIYVWCISAAPWQLEHLRFSLDPLLLYGALVLMLTFPWFGKGLYALFSIAVLAPLLVWLGSIATCHDQIITRASDFLGWISFSLYCLHEPVFQAMQTINSHVNLLDNSGLFLKLGAITVTVVLSIITGASIDRLGVQRRLTNILMVRSDTPAKAIEEIFRGDENRDIVNVEHQLDFAGPFGRFMIKHPVHSHPLYAVGVIQIDPGFARIADLQRPAPIVEFWYPSEPGEAESAVAQHVLPRSAIPPPFRRPKPANSLDARLPTDCDKFPFLLYFPGWAATAVDNTAVIEELAGAGFIVAAFHYPAALPGLPIASVLRQRTGLELPMDFTSSRAFAETIDRADRRVCDRASDAVELLDIVCSPKADGVARGLLDRVDAERVGILGFSLGGAVAAEACVRDLRFRAALNLDGWHFGEALERGVSQPYLFISDDTPLPTLSDMNSPNPVVRYTSLLNRRNHDRLVANLAKHGGHLLRIAGSRHEHFSCDRRGIDFRSLVRRSRISPSRVFEIVARYTLSFFAEHLTGEKSGLLSGETAPYCEVHLRSWPRPTINTSSPPGLAS